MGSLGRVRHGAGLVASHPALIGWYLRNKLRVATLNHERRHWEGRSRPPRGITLRLTNACNLKCKMCRFVESGDVNTSLKETMPLEMWKGVVDDVARYKPYFTFTGGEPLMCPWAAELVTHITKQNLRCTVTTNGTLLAKCAPGFMEHPPDLIVISVDGPREVHNQVRGQERAFERATEGIAAVRQLRSELRSKYPLLAINCAISPWSYEHVEEMIDIALELGIDALNFQHMWSMTTQMVDEHNEKHGSVHNVCAAEMGAFDPPAVDLDRMVSAVNAIKRRAASQDKLIVTFHPELSEAQIRQWYSDPHTWLERKPAVCGWINVEVAPNGEVEPCYGLTAGNVNEAPLSKLWNGAGFRDFRRRLAVDSDFPICRRCCAFFRRD